MNSSRPVAAGEPHCHVSGRLATGLMEVSSDPDVLDSTGFWAVIGTFEGSWTFARFARVAQSPLPEPSSTWPGVSRHAWTSSLSQSQYVERVEAVRGRIARGEVYQVNLCRMLSAELPRRADLGALATRVAAGNPAPYAARVSVPELGVDVVSASPELFLRRDGDRVASSPIKGTGASAHDLTAKDVAENVMIVDLVRNDLGRVCLTGTVAVDGALAVEQHPGLVQLVSTVHGRLRPALTWSQLLDATFPPGSVSGAPKSTALATIGDLEAVPRGAYCGAIGWVDADRRLGELAVGIRTFYRDDNRLTFGTGAGITWGSDPRREWYETELKARRLLGLAADDGSLG